MDIKNFVDKKRIEFLDQDKKTLWGFVEDMCQETYNQGRDSYVEQAKFTIPRTRVIRPITTATRIMRGGKRQCQGPNCKIQT